MKHSLALGLALALGLSLGLAVSGAQAADTVTIQLKWVAQAQFAGYFVARDKGFYKEAGLDVTIKPGGPDVAPPQVIAGGGADVVVDWMPSALASREKGVPLVNISQTFKKSGLEITCRADTGIKKPTDLKGKTVGIWYGGNEYPFLSWMSKLGYKTDGSAGGVKVIKQGFNVDPILQKQADCVSTMTYNEYWQVIDGGYKPSQLVVFKYEDEGVATLEDGLWVLEKNLKDPAFVTKMAKFVNPNENLDFTATSTFLRYKTHLTANSVAPYVMDTLKFSEAWEATVGLRYDHFAVDYNDASFSTTAPGVIVKADHIEHTDNMGSYRGALTYKPAGNGSIYFAFGTSFNPSAEDLSLISSSRSFSLNNANLDPEKNRTYELGTKWALIDHLDLSAAIFRLEKENARVPDPTNVLLNILGGSQRVDGAELRAEGQLTAKWRIDAGYEYLDGKQTGSTKGAAPVGAPLMNTPKHALTVWNVYQILPRFEVGGGSRFVSSQFTQNVPPIKTVPGFWTFDAMAKYAFTANIAAQLNVNNLTNRYYYDQLHFFHVVPGEGRTALLSLNVRY